MSQIVLDGTGAVRQEWSNKPKAGADQAIAIAAGMFLFVAAGWVAAFRQQAWEYKLLWALNEYAGRSALLDRFVHALTSRELLQGVIFVALLWCLWFSADAPEIRHRLLAGAVAAVLAGIISRLLQIGLPTHLRPLHTPALAFVPPIGVEPDALNHFSSFPSDHGAVFFALALVIARVRLRLGIAAFVWAAIVDVARVYDGFHYPSDIVGSIGLAIVIVTLCDNRWVHRLANRAFAFETSHRQWFYMLAFLISYQIATLFDDVREIAVGSASVFLHHGL
jgi:undecaprenyl-diphosphatase